MGRETTNALEGDEGSFPPTHALCLLALLSNSEEKLPVTLLTPLPTQLNDSARQRPARSQTQNPRLSWGGARRATGLPRGEHSCPLRRASHLSSPSSPLPPAPQTPAPPCSRSISFSRSNPKKRVDVRRQQRIKKHEPDRHLPSPLLARIQLDTRRASVGDVRQAFGGRGGVGTALGTEAENVGEGY